MWTWIPSSAIISRDPTARFGRPAVGQFDPTTHKTHLPSLLARNGGRRSVFWQSHLISWINWSPEKHIICLNVHPSWHPQTHKRITYILSQMSRNDGGCSLIEHYHLRNSSAATTFCRQEETEEEEAWEQELKRRRVGKEIESMISGQKWVWNYWLALCLWNV